MINGVLYESIAAAKRGTCLNISTLRNRFMSKNIHFVLWYRLDNEKALKHGKVQFEGEM